MTKIMMDEDVEDKRTGNRRIECVRKRGGGMEGIRENGVSEGRVKVKSISKKIMTTNKKINKKYMEGRR